ncbi:AEC family transporter [uncultured Tessaracoccus sp.]|uniref:AEC family transporter n=1 Tax=uncultured Tessaracoccus sp. TaxID=905023 RepID=UPI0025F2641C|nr:AEC family transporter [uncultured Tessaracoccus sp.]
MLHVLSGIVPIVLVVTLGTLLTKLGMFSRDDIAALSRFVVKVALPLLIFVNVSGRPVTDLLQPTYLLTYAGIAALMYAVARLRAWATGGSRVRAAFLGMGMSGTNNGFMGFPMLLILVPEWAGAAVGMSMVVDSAFIIPLGLFLADHAASTGTPRERLLRTARHVFLHPMVIAIVLALSMTAVGLHLPGPIARTVDLLAVTSSGVALFAIGGFIASGHVRGAVVDVVAGAVGKLVVAPLLVIAFARALPALGVPALPTPLLVSLVLLCSLPTFSIMPSLADAHGEADFASASVMVQTVASFVTISGWLLVLEWLGWLPAL